MRLLIWTESFWPVIGGVETYLKHFIPAIRQLGYDVSVVAPLQRDYKERETVDGAQVYRLPFHKVLTGKDPEAFFALRRQVEKIRNDFAPDVVQVILMGPSVVFHIETNKRAPIPTVVAIHSDLFSRTDGLGNITHRALNQADHVISVSGATLGDLETMFPQIRGKSSFIYNGLVTGGIKPTSLPADSPRLLCIGRLVNLKGFDLALVALARVRQKFPATTLTIAGDGEERAELEKQAQDLGLRDAVTFAGWRSPGEIYDLIGESTVVLIPSRVRETFSLVAVEAALMGRPVIATRAGGLEEVVIDGETGILVNMGDAAAITEALEKVLAQPELTAHLGARARGRALERFSIATNAAAYDALYRRVLASI